MTLAEFKAWFEGFTENIDGPPNAKQWKRIKARVKEIDGESVTPVYIDRWIGRYRRYWEPYQVWCSDGQARDRITATFSNDTAAQPVSYDTTAMLADMGRAEWKSLDA